MKEILLKNDEVNTPIWIRSWEESHGITLCCIILNEEKMMKEFLNYYRPYVDSIVMVDGGSSDRTVELATPLVDEIRIHKVDGHYSNQYNRAMEMVRTDWVLTADADERIEKPVLENLRNLINQQEFDCFAFPRKNYVDGVYDEAHFPDYQERLHRSYCRRIRPVHHELVGYKKKFNLPCNDGNYMIHKKGTDRHMQRNNAYLLYELKYKHEMGYPGAQTKETFEAKLPHLHESIIRPR